MIATITCVFLGIVEMRLNVFAPLTAYILFGSTILCGQDSAAEFADGPMQDCSEAIGNLVRMTVNGKVLALKREWEQEDKSEEKQDHLDKEVQRLLKLGKGFDAEMANRIARRQLRGIHEFNHPIANEFDKLKIPGGSSSAGVSISGNRMTSHFSNRIMRARIEVDKSRIKLNITEKTGPERKLDVSDKNNGEFSVKYSGEDFLIELKQKADGSIKLSRVRGDDADDFNASNYLELRKENPKVVNQWLVPLLQHVGFTIPIVSDDEPVQQAVLSKLVGVRSRSMKDFDQLIRDLDSDEFRTREEATERLSALAGLWQDVIKKQLKSSSISVEVRVRLQGILIEEKAHNPIDELIASQDLMNSTDYLATLFAVANEQEKSAISKQLEQITNHSEPTSEAWLEWLSKSENKNRTDIESP